MARIGGVGLPTPCRNDGSTRLRERVSRARDRKREKRERGGRGRGGRLSELLLSVTMVTPLSVLGYGSNMYQYMRQL